MDSWLDHTKGLDIGVWVNCFYQFGIRLKMLFVKVSQYLDHVEFVKVTLQLLRAHLWVKLDVMMLTFLVDYGQVINQINILGVILRDFNQRRLSIDEDGVHRRGHPKCAYAVVILAFTPARHSWVYDPAIDCDRTASKKLLLRSPDVIVA